MKPQLYQVERFSPDDILVLQLEYKNDPIVLALIDKLVPQEAKNKEREYNQRMKGRKLK